MSERSESPTNSDGEETPLAVLKRKQNKERKELQTKITGMKRAVPSSDKKRKKEVTSQIEKLEEDLKKKHDAEIADLEKNFGAVTVEDPVDDRASEAQKAKEEAIKKKMAKNQKKHDKKLAEAKRRAELAEEEEALGKVSKGHLETVSILETLSDRKLAIVDIAPDGDCLFNALAHQLSINGIDLTGENIRTQVADYIREHSNDFLPFLTDDNGEKLTKSGFKEYCAMIQAPSHLGGIWGGAPELRATSQIFKKKIEIIQPDNQLTVFGEDFKGKPLVITYHRFAYNLGEHYNSTVDV
uniref:OTU domain-containing protein n=1 Tax=Panagrolaimus sp. JU765 TaxID=591449 RepID=A0AC34RI09_9BILA